MRVGVRPRPSRCTNRDDTDVWNKAAAIKSKVLGLWDTAPTGVRVACTKFAQRVVLVQSRGTTDPRVSAPARWPQSELISPAQLIDRSDTSLALVPTNHPLLSLPALDAESQGLLDRLLSILHDDPRQVLPVQYTGSSIDRPSL